MKNPESNFNKHPNETPTSPKGLKGVDRRQFFMKIGGIGAAVLTTGIPDIASARDVEGISGKDYFNTKEEAMNYIKKHKGNFESYVPDPKFNHTDEYIENKYKGFKKIKISTEWDDNDDESKGDTLGVAVLGNNKYGRGKWVVFNSKSYIWANHTKNEDGIVIKSEYKMEKCANGIKSVESVYEGQKSSEIIKEVKSEAPIESKQTPDKNTPCKLFIPYNGDPEGISMDVWLSDDKRTNEQEKFLTVRFNKPSITGKDGKPDIFVFNDPKEVELLGNISTYKGLVSSLRKHPVILRNLFKHVGLKDQGFEKRQTQTVFIVNNQLVAPQGSILPPGYISGPQNVVIVQRTGQPVMYNNQSQLDVFLNSLLKIGIVGYLLKGMGY